MATFLKFLICIWDDYSERKISPHTLLKLISKLHEPSFQTTPIPRIKRVITNNLFYLHSNSQFYILLYITFMLFKLPFMCFQYSSSACNLILNSILAFFSCISSFYQLQVILNNIFRLLLHVTLFLFLMFQVFSLTYTNVSLCFK